MLTALLAMSDTPHGLTPGGCSVHPRREPRASPQALPAPVHGPRRVLVRVQHQATGGTDRGAPRAPRLDTHAASAALLAGAGGVHHPHVLPGALCLVGKGGTDLLPAGIPDALGQRAGASQVGDPPLCEREGILGAQQRARCLVREGAPLPAHLLVPRGDRHPRLLAARAPRLAPRPALLRRGEVVLRLWVVPGILHPLPRWRDEKYLQPPLSTRLLARRREGLGEPLRAGAGDVPAVGRLGDGAPLNGPHEQAAPAPRATAHLGEHQEARVHAGPVALRVGGERVGAGAALEAGQARLLPRHHAVEERRGGSVPAGQHVVPHLAVPGGIRREHLTDVRALGFLLLARDRAALPPSPPGTALLQRGMVARAAAPQDPLQRSLLGGRGLELLLVGRADPVARRAAAV